jgi:hypothetical protein
MSSKHTVIRPNQVNFFPRERRTRRYNLQRNDSLAAFKKHTSPSPPKSEGEKTNRYAVLVPAWLQRYTSWIKQCISSNGTEEEEYRMSGASSGFETGYRYDESKRRDVELWEEYPLWDTVEGRMVELGLS